MDDLEQPVYSQLLLPETQGGAKKKIHRRVLHVLLSVVLVVSLGAATISGYSIYEHSKLRLEQANEVEDDSILSPQHHNFELKSPNESSSFLEKDSNLIHDVQLGESHPKPRQETSVGRIARAGRVCPKGWHNDQRHQLCYKKIYNVAYDDALRACARLGAHIVKIDSNEKNQIILELTSSGHPNELQHGNTLLGARKKMEEFVWDDGSEFSYSRWADNEPNNLFGSEGCIVLFTDSIIGIESASDVYVSRWNDIPCDQTQRVSVCEKPAKTFN